jgi:hypothetical protein
MIGGIMRKIFGGWLVELAFILYVFLALWAAACTVKLAYGDTTAQHKTRNGFGTLSYQDNPNAYLMGYVSNATPVQVSKSEAIVVLEVRPTNTYMMFSQQLQLCGDIEPVLFEKLLHAVGSREVIVFTYSRIRHRQDCNDLYRIDTIKDVLPEQQ